MKSEDRRLGMHQAITRRDLLQGAGVVAAAALIPGRAVGASSSVASVAGPAHPYYPPSKTGLRGSHTGSFEVAHAVAREGKRDWGPVMSPDSDVYDLVIVGAGISGLSAAHFYRKEHPAARILILENHDDFGGHAKRNEFDVDGHTLLGYGGSQSIEEPSEYPEVALQMFSDLGIDLSKFDRAYDQGFYQRNGLAGGVFFDRENWGKDQLIPYDLGSLGTYLPLSPSTLSETEAVARMPMSETARKEFLQLLTSTQDNLGHLSADEKTAYLYSISYRDYLIKHRNVSAPEVFATLNNLATDTGLGMDAASAGDAFQYMFMPGFLAAGFPGPENDDPYIHHFPDGNASVARQLVRSMIPEVAPGSTMEDLVTAQFDYNQLDRPAASVRLRLNSTVTRVVHAGGEKPTGDVQVSYVRGGQAYKVKARSCILACYNAIIPSLCPELPHEQQNALSNQVKTPILYTNVALRNWRAWKKLGVGGIVAPGGYHANAMLDFPVSMGGYDYSANPDQPIVVHMEKFLRSDEGGLSVKDRWRLGRQQLMMEPFEIIERHIRKQLADMLAGGGFDPAGDIAAITVNRWAHGYSYGYDSMEDPYYDDPNDERFPHVQARKQFGRISIANCDSAATALLHAAVEQAHRAVGELS
ncbi:MAG: NAD(P)-binding protein [Halioglobus sp.]